MVTEKRLNPTAYRIENANWRSSEVTVIDPDGVSHRVTLGVLRSAGEGETAALYRALTLRAAAALEGDRRASVAACRSHQSIRTSESGYVGPVSHEDNRAAHGNIMRSEVCRCGAERHVNINGRHVEQGVWG